MSKAPITAVPHVFYIRPAPGWLDVLHEEVLALVKAPLQKYKFEPKVTLLKSTVKLQRCDWRQGLEVLLRLTTAHDVEWMLSEAPCTQWADAENILERTPWDEVLANRNIPVHVTIEISNGFTSSSSKLREKVCEAARVTHVSEGGQIRLKADLKAERLRVTVSLAGEPLYKRGYKSKMVAAAPLAEHQAAACIRWALAGQDKKSIVDKVYVPFAGSGTFGFEAALAFAESGPGAFGREFACELFPATPSATIGFLRRKLAERLTSASNPKILFNDFHPLAVSVLKENVAGFPNSERFEVNDGDVFDYQPKIAQDESVLVLLNPPFGDRLAKDSAVAEMYGRLGNYLRNLSQTLRNRFLVGCICPDEPTWRAFLSELGKGETETHHFTHGGKDMRFVRWQKNTRPPKKE